MHQSKPVLLKKIDVAAIGRIRLRKERPLQCPRKESKSGQKRCSAACNNFFLNLLSLLLHDDHLVSASPFPFLCTFTRPPAHWQAAEMETAYKALPGSQTLPWEMTEPAYPKAGSILKVRIRTCHAKAHRTSVQSQHSPSHQDHTSRCRCSASMDTRQEQAGAARERGNTQSAAR